MFENALISVNWSGTGVDAAALARSLCAPDAQLTLAHVHAEVPMSPDPLVMHLRKFELRQSMRALKGAAYATQVQPTLSVGAPSVGEGLAGLVGMIGADLLVLGPVDGLALGAAQLSAWLNRTGARPPAAIAVASKGFAAETAGVRRVGVVNDGSVQSERALALAQPLAHHLGSRLKTFELRSVSPGPRRRVIAERRLAQFSAGVDLLVCPDPVHPLTHASGTALLIPDGSPTAASAAGPGRAGASVGSRHSASE